MWPLLLSSGEQLRFKVRLLLLIERVYVRAGRSVQLHRRAQHELLRQLDEYSEFTVRKPRDRQKHDSAPARHEREPFAEGALLLKPQGLPG